MGSYTACQLLLYTTTTSFSTSDPMIYRAAGPQCTKMTTSDPVMRFFQLFINSVAYGWNTFIATKTSLQQKKEHKQMAAKNLWAGILSKLNARERSATVYMSVYVYIFTKTKLVVVMSHIRDACYERRPLTRCYLCHEVHSTITMSLLSIQICCFFGGEVLLRVDNRFSVLWVRLGWVGLRVTVVWSCSSRRTVCLPDGKMFHQTSDGTRSI